jgi:transposase
MQRTGDHMVFQSLVCQLDFLPVRPPLKILLRGRKVLAAWLYRSYATPRWGYA